MLKWLMNTKEIFLAVFVNAKSKAVVGGWEGGGEGGNSERLLISSILRGWSLASEWIIIV